MSRINMPCPHGGDNTDCGSCANYPDYEWRPEEMDCIRTDAPRYKFIQSLQGSKYCFQGVGYTVPRYIAYNILDSTYYVCSSDWEQSHPWTNSRNLLMLVPDEHNLYTNSDVEKNYYFQTTVRVDHVLSGYSIADAKQRLIDSYYQETGIDLTEDEITFIEIQED